MMGKDLYLVEMSQYVWDRSFHNWKCVAEGDSKDDAGSSAVAHYKRKYERDYRFKSVKLLSAGKDDFSLEERAMILEEVIGVIR